jgi:hypothetical protein
MTTTSTQKPSIIRTERELIIAGTRITIYDVMDYVSAQYPLLCQILIIANAYFVFSK